MENNVFYPILKIKYPFEIIEMDGETVAVAVENGAEKYNGMIKLGNESARFMFLKLQKGINLPDLIYLCTKEFNDDVENVGPVVLDFLEKLRAEDLIVPVLPKGMVKEN